MQWAEFVCSVYVLKSVTLSDHSGIVGDETAALDAVEGIAPGGAFLDAVGVHTGAADAEQRLVLKVAPKLRRDIVNRQGKEILVFLDYLHA